MELSSQTTSKEDLTDLDQVASLGLNAGAPSNEAKVTENQNQPELQVHECNLQRKVPTCSIITSPHNSNAIHRIIELQIF